MEISGSQEYGETRAVEREGGMREEEVLAQKRGTWKRKRLTVPENKGSYRNAMISIKYKNQHMNR